MVVVETRQFERQAELLITPEEKHALIWFVGLHPESGDLIQGTGGARKLRWATGGHGKRGGVRLVYYFHSEAIPLFLFTVYKKGRKDDLTKVEEESLRKLIRTIRRELIRR